MPLKFSNYQIGQEISRIENYCKANDYVFTPQRKIVVNQLLFNNEFLEADDLWLQIIDTKCKISLPAVYTVLRWLVRGGFAEQQTSRGRKQGYRYKFTSAAGKNPTIDL